MFETQAGVRSGKPLNGLTRQDDTVGGENLLDVEPGWPIVKIPDLVRKGEIAIVFFETSDWAAIAKEDVGESFGFSVRSPCQTGSPG